MNRRKFLELNGWLFGFTLAVGSGNLLTTSCSTSFNKTSKSLLDEKDAQLLNELAEIIIPTTDTPGGKETNPGNYIVLIHNECLNEDEQVSNKNHLIKLKELLKLRNEKDIAKLNKPETIDFVIKLDEEKNESFRIYKNLIVSAFLSSELGASKFLNFSLVPGKYEGCTPNRPW